MKLIDTKEQPREGDVRGKELRNSLLKEFQISAPYEIVMSIIQEALDRSIVQELIYKKQGDVNETEIGRLTLIEWAAKQRIEEIKNLLTKKYE
jgi:hypothetical protein